MWHEWGTHDLGTGFWWGDVMERDHLYRCRHRWDDNIKMYVQDVGWRDRDCIAPGRDRDRWQALVNAAMNLRVP